MAIHFNGNDVEFPVRGSLTDLHQLIMLLSAPVSGEQVTIDGKGYTLTVDGFKSNDTGSSLTAAFLEGSLDAHIAFLLGFDESHWMDVAGSWKICTYHEMKAAKDTIKEITQKKGS